MAAKAKNNKVGSELGCGLMGRILHLKSHKLRKASVHSLPFKNPLSDDDGKSQESKKTPSEELKATKKSCTDTEPLRLSGAQQKLARKTASVHQQQLSTYPNSQNQRHSDVVARSSTSSTSSPRTSISTHTKVQQNKDKNHESKPYRDPTENSLALARISTGNENNKSQLKLTGNLLVNNTPRRKSVEYMPKNAEFNYVPVSYSNTSKGLMGNIMRRNSTGNELGQFFSPRQKKVDPEVLKSMGNEAYKQGRFEEALSLYDRAIALDSNMATYHCNRSAALIGLGRLQEAIFECEESIKLDPSYVRAHNRLATIYFRLGEAEKALDCNQSTGSAGSILAFQAQALQNHLNKCTEARKVNAWSDILRETQSAISLGADSAPQVYALQTEAFLKLLRYQEAYAIYENMPKFPLDWCTKVFGPARSAYLLMIGAMVYLAAGRFEEAVTAAQQAAKVDPGNREVNAMVRRARAATSARMSGNLLFKASKFTEACAVYNEGLDHDPHNSVLLCNRAACRSKLGQYEKAIEDCNAALMFQPGYSKARLRRADCNAKLERWEAAIQDYEMLLRERPGDEEVARALFEAQLQLKMLRGEDIKDLKFGSNLVFISSNDRFRHYVTSPGMAVVLFSNKATHKKVLLMLEQTSKRFPSVHFLKVEIEDHPYLAKSEGVSSIPAFRVYKNGSRVKEISGNNYELLERSVELYSR
ncbi:TPR repeat-containing thioredoxin TTL1-like [Vigna umbellata]|uniref:TPR repeat-containing thioredoxin TTL1-like n=1 Tax=Vigna umbellata TaxID=87088 RepID=UPI001F5E9271|nr:TPR repeat-containing thioredoxin TTL1-like [Vigna umbellata]